MFGNERSRVLKVLAIDVGGTNIKVLASGENGISQVSVRAEVDSQTDGVWSQGHRQGLEV